MDDMTYQTETLYLGSEEKNEVSEELKEVEAFETQLSRTQPRESPPDENTFQHDIHGVTASAEDDWISVEDDDLFRIEYPEPTVDAENGTDISVRRATRTGPSSPEWDEDELSPGIPSTQDFSWDVDANGNRNIYPEIDETLNTPATDLEELEKLNNPFPEVHYFYNYLVTTSEGICLSFARAFLLPLLTSQNRLRLRLGDPDHPANYSSPFEMADKEWNQPGQIELDKWNYFFEKIGILHCSNENRIRIFDCLGRVRQAAVHRKHGRIGKDALEVAMELAKVMWNTEKDTEIKRVYSILTQNAEDRSPEDQRFFDKCVYTQNNPPILISEFLAHLQHLCETAAFSYARTVDPEFLSPWNADCAERIELQQYTDRWANSSSSVDAHPAYREAHPDTDSTRSDWRYALHMMKQLRIVATHRLATTDPRFTDRADLEQWVHWAKRFVAMTGDEAMVARVQRVGEEWLNEYRPVEESREEEAE